MDYQRHVEDVEELSVNLRSIILNTYDEDTFIKRIRELREKCNEILDEFADEVGATVMKELEEYREAIMKNRKSSC